MIGRANPEIVAFVEIANNKECNFLIKKLYINGYKKEFINRMTSLTKSQIKFFFIKIVMHM